MGPPPVGGEKIGISFFEIKNLNYSNKNDQKETQP